MSGSGPEWAPATIGLDAPSSARVWDYFLGGSHNFTADRQVAEAAIALKPDMPESARQAQMFLHRAVRAIAGAGVSQFLDIGAGIPTVTPVHAVARGFHPRARVVYVDHDPVAVAHGQAMLAEDPDAFFVPGDLRTPKAILDDPRVRGLLDFSRPVGLLLCGVLHFVSGEDDPAGIVAALREVLAPGSFLALQHATVDEQPPEAIEMLRMWNARSPEPMSWRTRAEIAGLLDGFEVQEPGVVFLPCWRPDPGTRNEECPGRFATYAALGRLASQDPDAAGGPGRYDHNR